MNQNQIQLVPESLAQDKPWPEIDLSDYAGSGRHALVIGSGIAGLTAARVLTDHFDRVTIVERDVLPEEPVYRKGVPQGNQIHAILLGGLRVLEQQFPGVTTDLQAAGAVSVNLGSEARLHMLGHWRVRFPSAYTALAATRPLLEGMVRQRLAVNPRITFVQGVEVTGICTNEARTQATGVRLRRRGVAGAEALQIEADLVVAATGRGSRVPEWLTELGFPAPRETVVDGKPGYATRVYRFSQPPAFDWKVMYLQPLAPDQRRGAILVQVEDDQWQASLIGMGGDYPPTDEEGFMEFARTLPVPDFVNALQNAEPISPIRGYRRMENRRWHYEDLPRYLENFLVCGDAVYAFNPAYGQGMSVAAMASMKLDNCLRQQKGDLTGLAARFQKELIDVIEAPWQLATGQDRDWQDEPDTSSGRMARLMQRYIRRVLEAMMHDATVAEIFLSVQQMLASPARLFYPDVLWRTLRPRGRAGAQPGRKASARLKPARERPL
jgi:2-polyprenyl-6-methoxyphenol hydroxylase-like FAD-dependent oxidoreductase